MGKAIRARRGMAENAEPALRGTELRPLLRVDRLAMLRLTP